MLVVDFVGDGLEAKDQIPKADGSLAYTAFKDRLLRDGLCGAEEFGFRRVLSGGVACPGVWCVDDANVWEERVRYDPWCATGFFAVNGKEITAQIDSLFGGTMLIYPTSVEKLGFPRSAGGQVDEEGEDVQAHGCAG